MESLGHGGVELGERLQVVVLGVDHEDEGAAPAEDHVSVEGSVEKVHLVMEDWKGQGQ